MANRERNKRSARKARAQERAELEAAHAQASSANSKSTSPAAKETPKAAAKKESKRTGLFGRLTNYLKEVRSEVKRVVWPSKSELKNYSIAVIGMLIVFGLVIWALDSGIVAGLIAFTGLRG